jgi:hypothetical protein
MRPDRLGLVIGATFGLIYVEVNAGAVPSPVGPLLRVLGVIAFVGVLVALWCAPVILETGLLGCRPLRRPSGVSGRTLPRIRAEERCCNKSVAF